MRFIWSLLNSLSQPIGVVRRFGQYSKFSRFCKKWETTVDYSDKSYYSTWSFILGLKFALLKTSISFNKTKKHKWAPNSFSEPPRKNNLGTFIKHLLSQYIYIYLFLPKSLQISIFKFNLKTWLWLDWVIFNLTFQCLFH